MRQRNVSRWCGQLVRRRHPVGQRGTGWRGVSEARHSGNAGFVQTYEVGNGPFTQHSTRASALQCWVIVDRNSESGELSMCGRGERRTASVRGSPPRGSPCHTTRKKFVARTKYGTGRDRGPGRYPAFLRGCTTYRLPGTCSLNRWGIYGENWGREGSPRFGMLLIL